MSDVRVTSWYGGADRTEVETIDADLHLAPELATDPKHPDRGDASTRPGDGGDLADHGRPGIRGDGRAPVELAEQQRETSSNGTMEIGRTGIRHEEDKAARSDGQELDLTDTGRNLGQWDGTTAISGTDSGKTARQPTQAATESGFTSSLIDQVEKLQQLREKHRSMDPVHRITMTLEPAQLGKVDATVDLQNGEVRIRMAPHTQAGETALANQLDGLRNALADRGLVVRELRVLTAGSAGPEPLLRQSISNPVGTPGTLTTPETLAPSPPSASDGTGSFLGGHGFLGNHQGRGYFPNDEELALVGSGSQSRRHRRIRSAAGIAGGSPSYGSGVAAPGGHGWPQAMGLDVTI